MQSMTFEIEGEVGALITITEQPDGTLLFEIDQTSDTGSIADLRGLFFDVADESLVDGLSVSGDDVTDTAFKANKVGSLGQDANLNGEIVNEYGKFDAGVEFGTMGVGKDDIRSTSFTLSHDTEALTLDLVSLQDFGVRMTSVGDEGSRDGSLKLGGTAPEAEAGTDTGGETEPPVEPEPEPQPEPEPPVVENMAPDAIDDTFSFAIDPRDGTGESFLNSAATTLDVGAILANDADPDGDALTVTAMSGTTALGATVDLNDDGTFTYTAPTDRFHLEGVADGDSVADTFTYTVSDGRGGEDTATVTFTEIYYGEPTGGPADPEIIYDRPYDGGYVDPELGEVFI